MVSHSLCNAPKFIFLIDDDRSFTTQPPLGQLSTRSQRELLRFQNPSSSAGSRLVVHIQTSDSAVDDFLAVVRTLAEEKKAAGFVKPEEGANGVIKDVYVRRVPK
jgi:threonine aldolase